MDALARDLRYAARGLLRNPGFTALTVLCLALGIGINSTVFSIADTVSWRPLPFDTDESLVALYATQPSNAVDQGSTSYLDFQDWKAQSRSYAEMAAQSYRNLSLTEGVASERFQGSAVTWNMFPMLGTKPIVGRHFRAEDDRAGAAPVVMIGYNVWQSRYGGDPSILNRTLIVDGTAHTVIGVMPPRFAFPQFAELWVPLTPLYYNTPRTERAVRPFARLAPGTTIEVATRELAAAAERLSQQHREDEGWSARVVSLRNDFMPAQIQTATVAMMGAVFMVLMVACANVANMLLARATARQREIAVRTAIGAGRGQVIRQLLTESTLLGLLSAPLGVLIAYGGLQLLTNATPPASAVPWYVDWRMNDRVIAYTVSISVLTGLIFGFAPAWQTVRSNLFTTLRDGGRSGNSPSKNRLRNALVVAEVALSLVLLVGAALFVRSFLNIQNADGGIDERSLLTMRVYMADRIYEAPDTVSRRTEDIVRRIEALPGVVAAFGSNLVPLGGGGGNGGILPEGLTVQNGREPRVQFFGTTSHAVRTLNQTLVAGRDFTDAEASTRSAVAIVNQSFVKRFWPGTRDAIGRRFRFANSPDEWLTVIGTVTNFQPTLPRDKALAEPLAILPFPYHVLRDVGVTIRVAGAPASIAAAARQAVGVSDPTLAVSAVQTAAVNREARAWGSRIMSAMFAVFGVVALFLAAIGIYGVLAYSVAQRTQEFGIRIALGATRTRVLRLVLAQGCRLALVGILLGGAGAIGVTRLVRSLLYNVTPSDPASFLGTALMLAAVTVLAGAVPALRATAVDPIVALRVD
jgi:putative ABC transport system permease protein